MSTNEENNNEATKIKEVFDEFAGNMLEVLDKIENVRNHNLINEEIILLTIDGVTGIEPEYGTKFSACKDLFSPINTVVPAGKRVLIMTNVAIAWDNDDYYMQLLSKSGIAWKKKTDVKAGVIDIDYRKNIGVILHNYSDVDFEIKTGDPIAQYIYLKSAEIESKVVTEFTTECDSDRIGGFGSTSK